MWNSLVMTIILVYRLFLNGWICSSLISHPYFLWLVSYRPAAINTTTYHIDWDSHIVAGGILIAECILPIHLAPIAMLCSPLLLTVIIFITFKLQTLLNISSPKVMSTSYWMTKGNYVQAVDLPRDSILSSILTPVSWTPGYRATMRTRSYRTNHSWPTCSSL